MKIAIGSDHAGLEYKQILVGMLHDLKQDVADFGTASNDPVDYPDIVYPVARAVAAGEYDRGIVLGGSGNGEAMVANRVRGVRCALCLTEEMARLARAHNDANMVSLGQRLISQERAMACVRIWLETPFDGGRHRRRIDKMDKV